MHDSTAQFLADLTAALVAASILGAIARRLGVTPVLGYVVAGIIIGPFTPGYQASTEALGGLSELGLILLLFSLGLGFSVSELRAVGVVPMAGNLVLMALFSLAAWALGAAFGFTHPVTFGLTFALSSTAIGVALLKIFGLLDKRPGHAAVALLVAQDLVAVLILVVTTSPAGDLSAASVGLHLLKGGGFVIAALVLGGTVLHRVVVGFLRRAPGDAMVAFCTAVALVFAWAGHAAGLSYEFGAFIAGAVISEAAGSRMVESVVTPFRELFVLIFFVSIGTFVDVKAVAEHWIAIVAIGSAFTIVRCAGWFGLSRLVGQPLGVSVALGIALLPLGEFNVVLANASLAVKRLDQGEYATAVGATLLTIVLAAIATRLFAPRLRTLDAAEGAAVHAFGAGPQVLILGYGRVGRTVGSICKRAGVAFAVIETDVDLVHRAERDGAEAQYGDGGDPRIVERAIGPSIRVIVSTIPDTATNAGLVRRLSHQTGARVVARAHRNRDVRALREAGAHEVLVPESEGAYRLAATVLGALGVTEDRVAAALRDQRSTSG